MHQQQTVFENIVGKGEIARNEQFLLSPQCFLRNQIIVHTFDIITLFTAELEEPKVGISGKGLTLYQTTNFLDCSELKAFTENKINVNKKLKFVLRR